jgi:transposase-like protein
MSDFNHKDERIYRLYLRGLTIEQIARKIGMPDNTLRVVAGLQRKGVTHTRSNTPLGALILMLTIC